MGQFPDRELGLAEEPVVGLGGPEVGAGGLAERLVDPVGECDLIGSQGEPGLENPPCSGDDQTKADASRGSTVRDLPPNHFRDTNPFSLFMQ